MKTAAQKLRHLQIQLASDLLVSDTPGGIMVLTEWEAGFVQSVFVNMETRGEHSLSERQLTRIHEIYDKYFEA